METRVDSDSTNANAASTNTTAETAMSTKQAKIIEAVNGAVKQFKRESWWLILQLVFWSALCLLVISKGYCILTQFMDNITDKNSADTFKDFQNWQIYFYIIVRITFITALFSIASFLLKMFRSTYHIFQSNKHRLNIVRALPSFMASSNDPTKEEEILAIILKTVIKYNKTGLISRESDMKSGVSIIERLISKVPH
jgi:hypothetical protein